MPFRALTRPNILANARCCVTTGGELNINAISRPEIPGVTRGQSVIQRVTLVVFSIVTVWILYTVPSWSVDAYPFLLGTLATAVTVTCLWLTYWLGAQAMKFERVWLAAFLVGMPLIYMMGWLAARNHTAGWWIWIELLGLALFAALAVLGLKNSPWLLAIGIAGHGVAWDSWHYGNSAYVPDWYAVACLLVDLALAAYVAARVPAYKHSIVKN